MEVSEFILIDQDQTQSILYLLQFRFPHLIHSLEGAVSRDNPAVSELTCRNIIVMSHKYFNQLLLNHINNNLSGVFNSQSASNSVDLQLLSRVRASSVV